MKRPVVFALLLSLSAGLLLSVPSFADWRDSRPLYATAYAQRQCHPDRDRFNHRGHGRDHDNYRDGSRNRYNNGYYGNNYKSRADRIDELQRSVVAYQARVDKQRRNHDTNSNQYASDVYNLQSVQDELNRMQGGYGYW